MLLTKKVKTCIYNLLFISQKNINFWESNTFEKLSYIFWPYPPLAIKPVSNDLQKIFAENLAWKQSINYVQNTIAY